MKADDRRAVVAPIRKIDAAWFTWELPEDYLR
jgi:hypothetical protein